MKIYKIQVENFRLLKNFSIDVEDELSLVLGKNNTGKTSILSVLDKFLNHSDRNKFYYDYFNIDYKEELYSIINGPEVELQNYSEKGIKLKLFISYTSACNLESVSRVMMDLDPDNNLIVLGFEYVLPYEKYTELRSGWGQFKANEAQKHESVAQYKEKSLSDFLSDKHANYFRLRRKSIEISKDGNIVNESNFIDLDKEQISTKDIINFKYSSALRDVANKDVDKTLSTQTSKIYERTEISQEQNDAVEQFKDQLSTTDNNLSQIYSQLFKDIIDKVSVFGGIKPNEINVILNRSNSKILRTS